MDGLRALGSGRVLEDVLTIVIDSVLDATMAERGFIMLSDDVGELQFTIARRRGRQTLPGSSLETSVKIPRKVFDTGKPKIVDNLEADIGDHDETFAVGILRIVCVPLRVTPMGTAYNPQAEADRVIGVLYLDHNAPGHTHSSALLQSLEAFATQAALAIKERTALRGSRGKVSHRSRPPPGSRISALVAWAPSVCRPLASWQRSASRAGRSAANFYDYLEVAEGRLAFALADVAGKGPPAALLAAALPATLSRMRHLVKTTRPRQLPVSTKPFCAGLSRHALRQCFTVC